MSSSKKTQTQKVSSQPVPTQQEKEFNRLALEREQANQQGLIGTQSAGLDLAQRLLRGEQLPGFLDPLTRGIDPAVTQGLVDESLNDLNAQLQRAGVGTFLESGGAREAGVRTAGDIRRATEESNLNRLLGLLELGLGGQAQIQQPISNFANIFSSRLAGLRGQTGTQTQFQQGPTFAQQFSSGLASSLSNPFLRTGANPSFGFGG